LILIVRVSVGTMPAASFATVPPPDKKRSHKNHPTILEEIVEAFL